ncbi:MAG: phenylphosphate synthase subunit beta [Chloroflexales bacterium]|nr:phenylphosphate synthase subunit beta [Chloroflexales bacterium]
MLKLYRYIHWFRDCEKSHVPHVGGKNANLGEMTRAGMRVPPGFAVTISAYRDFLRYTRLAPEIRRILAATPSDDIEATNQASLEIQELISAAPIPLEIERAIVRAYDKLCAESSVADLPVAVRSSATAEDLPNASFAGQQDTSLWVRSAHSVLKHTVACWSSLFNARAISYRHQMGFPHEKVFISVGVQKMVNARAAGVMFTLNPSNGDRSKISIDASWGLGEAVASGSVTPDNFLIDKVALTIVKRTTSPKAIEYVPDLEARCVQVVPVAPERQSVLCLSDTEAIALARLGKQIERHYGCPQDIEWAIDQDLPFPENLVILQSRPETVWSQRARSRLSASGASGVEGVLASLLTPVRLR